MEEVVTRKLGRVAANGIELAYETFGDTGAPPVVLIMGLATQMIAWPDELCEGLAGAVFSSSGLTTGMWAGRLTCGTSRRRALPTSSCSAGHRPLAGHR